MVRPSAQLPVGPSLHPLEGLRLLAKQSKASTRSAIGFPGWRKRRVVAQLRGLVLSTREILP
eukprot:6480552-Amphidinium_carterae.1